MGSIGERMAVVEKPCKGNNNNNNNNKAVDTKNNNGDRTKKKKVNEQQQNQKRNETRPNHRTRRRVAPKSTGAERASTVFT